MAEVKLTNLVKAYPGGVVAVNDVSLLIPDGQFTVLVGPSGCGKSTTLRMVAGLEEITAGTIAIDDTVVNDVLPKDRDIAMVFQDYALYPHMDVYKNMAFGLKLRKFPRQEIDERVREAAKVLGLEKLLARKPRELSGGQRQRVAVGRAIVRRPKVFLFDEPLSNLDAKLRVEMRAELKRLHRQLQTTTIYVTHDQEEAMTLGDRVVVMKDGVVQQVGAPLDIYQAPVNRFVGSFLGTPPMNFVTGRVVEEGGPLVFDLGTAQLQLTAAHVALLKSHVNRELVLGIRPESISVKAEGRFAGVGNSLPGQLTVSEPLGEKIDVYFMVGDTRFIARVDAQRGLDEAQALTLYVDMTKVHVFDQGELGANLTLPQAEAMKAAEASAIAAQ